MASSSLSGEIGFFDVLFSALPALVQTLVPRDVPLGASINRSRAPRVNDDILSARHCVTECI